MIIDIILDRQDGAINYAPETHLKAIYDYATDARMTDIARALDSGNEADVRAALMRYIKVCGYPSALLDYVASVRWTSEDDTRMSTAVAAEKLALVRKVATRLRRKIKHERLAIVHDRRLGNVNYLDSVDALISAVKALPFPPDDIFRGTGDGTREYTALFTLQR